jgi:hypothetical protein
VRATSARSHINTFQDGDKDGSIPALHCVNIGSLTTAYRRGDHERHEQPCRSSMDFRHSRNRSLARTELSTSISERSESNRETNSIWASRLDCRARHFQQHFKWLRIVRIFL